MVDYTLLQKTKKTHENTLGYKEELDKFSAENLQDLETEKPKEAKEEKLYVSSDEVSIKNIMSNIIAETTSSQMLFPNSADIPLLSRINRLDIVLDYLEDAHLSGGSSTELPAMDGGKSVGCDEKSMEKRCKPIRWVLEEAEAKGTIMERVDLLEDRVKRIKEELEQRNSCDRAIKSNGTAEHMHLDSKGCEIVVEDEKHEVEVIPSESRQKGLHEEVSRRISQTEDIPKDNKDENFPKQNNIEILMREEERSAEEKNKNESRGKRGKGKLRRMFSGCISLHSH